MRDNDVPPTSLTFALSKVREGHERASRGDYSKALLSYQIALCEKPELTYLHGHLAECFDKLDMAEAAMKKALEALRYRPDNYQAIAIIVKHSDLLPQSWNEVDPDLAYWSLLRSQPATECES